MRLVRFQMLRSFVLLMGILVLTFSLPNRLPGQYTTASLGGTVVDQSGAAIADAKVTVLNTDTGFTQTVSSGAGGEYLFSRLPVGSYRLTVEKEGLTTYVQSGIQLTVSQAATQTARRKSGDLCSRTIHG